MTTLYTWTASPSRGTAAAPDHATRPRVLLSAFAVSPQRGSEPAVGWHLALRLAARYDVTVLCVPWIENEPYRQEIESHLHRHGPVSGLAFEYVERPPLWRWAQRDTQNGLLRRGLYYRGYSAWQRAAWARAQQLHRQRPFDLVHQLNITSYREPGHLWKMALPFVWGPITGAANFPRPYLPLLGWRERAFYGLRSFANNWQMRHRGRCRRAAQAARHIWVVTEEDRRMVADLWGCRCERICEVGTLAQPLARQRDYDGLRPLRLAWSGAHIGRKALPLLLHALAQLDKGLAWELLVLGGGSETLAWEALAAQLGIGPRVRWLGRLPHAQALDEVARADVFVSTSVQEATSTVILEALSLGLPVVCHDACGMGAAITSACGLKVPLSTPRESIDGIAAAISHLHRQPQELARLSAGALRRAQEMSWESTARRMAEVYDRVLQAACRGRETCT